MCGISENINGGNMMNNFTKWFILLIILNNMSIVGCSGDKTDSFPVLSGPYLGQRLPSEEPELFAPGIVTTGLITRDIAITPDGKEIYFCTATPGYKYTTIMVSKEIDGKWTEPESAAFARKADYMFLEPHITPDGTKMLFLTNLPDASDSGTHGDQDIWAVDRVGDGWGEPYNLGEPINTDESEFFPSVTNDGTLYFSRAEKSSRLHHIYRSKLVNGIYQESELLPESVNCGTTRYNTFIAPDESYIIVPAVGTSDSRGGADYYIVFRDKNDNWSDPVNLGDKINTDAALEFSPYVTRDGKYFFFTSARNNLKLDPLSDKITVSKLIDLTNSPENGNGDIYWMKADFIEKLRPEGF